ncbi:MAG: LysE family translocator [Pseudomonadota bacterium]
MSLEVWITFAIAAEIILVIPGPTILLVISQAIAHGRRSVVPLVIGVLLGDFTALILSMMGLGAVLAASAALFAVLKWIGAGYLFYLGLRLWRTDPQSAPDAAGEPAASGRTLFKSAFIVTALNPKSIAFFVAFLPQFVNPAAPLPLQLAILGATFLVMATVNAALYAVFAGELRNTMKNPRMRRWFDRCGGGALIGAGVLTATLRQGQ